MVVELLDEKQPRPGADPSCWLTKRELVLRALVDRAITGDLQALNAVTDLMVDYDNRRPETPQRRPRPEIGFVEALNRLEQAVKSRKPAESVPGG